MNVFLTTLVAIGAVMFGFFFFSSGEEATAPITEPVIEKSLQQIKTDLDNTEHQASILTSTITNTSIHATTKKEFSEVDEQTFDDAGDVIKMGKRKVSAELEARYQNISENEEYPTLLSRLSALDARRPNTHYSAEDVLSAMEKATAWEGSHQPGPNLNGLTQEELNDGRQFVDFDPLKIETLMVGDHMDVAIDSIGEVFNIQIDNIRIYEDGNVQWKGTITNTGGGKVAITQSEKITIATVVLEQDDFTLEAHGTDGWIVDSGTLFKVDPDHVDAIYPE